MTLLIVPRNRKNAATRAAIGASGSSRIIPIVFQCAEMKSTAAPTAVTTARKATPSALPTASTALRNQATFW